MMAKDPICGMTVDEESPLHAERDGETFYSYSDQCRQNFLPTPATAEHKEKPQGKAIYTSATHPEVRQGHWHFKSWKSMKIPHRRGIQEIQVVGFR